MSKIQKALDAIRKSPGGADDTATRRRPRDLRDKTESEELPVLRIDGTLGKDIAPKRAVEVDVKQLMDLGIYPRPADAELIAEQFRRIKRPVLQIAFDEQMPTEGNSNIIMMASAMPGAGKSFCSFNLANSISHERDFGSILVDADMLKPGLSRALGLQDEPGLTDYLMDPSIEISDVLLATDINDIMIIPAGHKNPEATELLASRRMRDLVSTLSEQFANRAVIFDTPPLLLTNEAQVLAEIAGQIVIVIEARQSSQESVMRAVSLLDRSKPINAILNKSRSASGGGYHSDDYGYYPSIGAKINEAHYG